MSRRRNQRKPTRREAIALCSGCAVLPFTQTIYGTLVRALRDGIIAKAQATSLPATVAPRSYFYIAMNGGPCRHLFDLPLAAYDSSTVAHPYINTRIQGTTLAYAVSQFPGGPSGSPPIYMPSTWSTPIPTTASSTSTAPMSDLLTNMLMIRGVNLGSDGHNLNRGRQIQPISTAVSLTGAVADRSTRSVAAVGLEGGPNDVFKSAKGMGQVIAPYADYSALPRILGAFERSGDNLSSTFVSRRDALASAMQAAMDQLGAYANSSRPGASALFDMRHSAELQMQAGVGNLASEFDVLQRKYQGLVDRSMDWRTLAFPGLTDQGAISASQLRSAVGADSLRMSSGGDVSGLTDFKTIIKTNTQIGALVGNFAIAEYLLKNGYSSAICAGIGGMSNFDGIPRSGDPTIYWGFDEHEGGAVPSLFVNAFLYRALAACLYELIRVLKANNLFDETVIHIGGDFNRNPANDDSDGKEVGGSGHGWMNSNTSVFSGAIKAPLIVGNTYKTRTGDGVNTAKAWGYAAPVLVDGAMQTLTAGHMTSTVAELLRVQHPMSNNGSLVQESQGGGIAPLVETAKNV